MKRIFPIICIFVIFTACNEDSIILSQRDYIDFRDLEDGQYSYFIRYESTCDNLNGDFVLTGDTLRVEVIEENNDFKFKESFTENSPMYINGQTEPTIHEVIPYDNFILIPERFNSALFFFYGNDTIHTRNFERENMVQNNCRVDFNGSTFIGNEIGLIDKFEIGDFEYKNKTVVSCLPMMIELDAYLIYDNKELVMSHTVDKFSNQIWGWKLIEK